MRSARVSRRSLLKTSTVAIVGLSGCVLGDEASPAASSSPCLEEGTMPTGSNAADGCTSVASLSASDFILYPLAGSHPHVHRRANTQYVVVRLDSSRSSETVRDRVTLELDGRSVSLAERQPVPWRNDTTDLAFAVPKDETFDSGRAMLDGTELAMLSTPLLDRLNNPPVFEVGDTSVSPAAVPAGAQIEATVEVTITNVGEGPGEFGASLTGNFVSGAETLTATLAAGAERDVTDVIRIIGEGDTARVRLDWGSDTLVTDIPVTGTPPESGTPTPTPGAK